MSRKEQERLEKPEKQERAFAPTATSSQVTMTFADEETPRLRDLTDLVGRCATLREVGRAYAFLVVARVGTKTEAARRLGVDRRTLQVWAKEERLGARRGRRAS